MKIKQVSKMKPVNRFLYWVKERHKIHLDRQAGGKKPWTDDEVLQSVFFTNPYRENDKTTIWFRENVRDYLADEDVLMATVIFRWFNKIETGNVLLGHEIGGGDLLIEWNKRTAIKRLEKWRDSQKKAVFTGAYMIKAGNGPPGSKIRMVCECIDAIWRDRLQIVAVCEKHKSLQKTWEVLKRYRGLGPFMAYEIVSDLRWTNLLEEADDIYTWANPGPGCMRGLYRLLGGQPIQGSGWKKDLANRLAKQDCSALDYMKATLHTCWKRLPRSKTFPKFEMREVEHSLCEFDKYERARTGSGKLKRNYNGSA